MALLTPLNLMFGLGIWFRSRSGSCLPWCCEIWRFHLQLWPQTQFFCYIREWKVSHLSALSPYCFSSVTTFQISISLFASPTVWRSVLEGGSSVHRSSHHLWNFRARPQWKGVLCPPDEECPRFARQRKGFIWPGIWRNLEKCYGDFLGGGDRKTWTGEEEALPTVIPKPW